MHSVSFSCCDVVTPSRVSSLLLSFSTDDATRPERRAWSRKEDDAIVRLVNEHGTKRWAFIAQEVRSALVIVPLNSGAR